MTDWTDPLVLASGSPRRRAMLEAVGIPIEVVPSTAPEIPDPAAPPEGEVLRLAGDKAAEVAARRPGRAVLAADTMVVLDGHLLGKPADHVDARRMLRSLSGRWHDVLTGVVLHHAGLVAGRVARTGVRFAELTDTEIDRYVAGPEAHDKAGAYGIQGVAGWFVAEVRGSASNVAGLPLETVREMLAEAGLPLPRLGSP